MRVAVGLLAGCLALSCTTGGLGSRDLLPGGEALRGADGSYELVPPTAAWVRIPENEATPRIELSLARTSEDARLNVSVLRERFASAEEAFGEARAHTEALLSVTRREESDVAVPAPGGDLPARLGRYCGTFDRELGAKESCVVILAVQRGRLAWVLVGQVRSAAHSDARENARENAREKELLAFVRSLRIVSEESR